jgi:hypothetical protein
VRLIQAIPAVILFASCLRLEAGSVALEDFKTSVFSSTGSPIIGTIAVSWGTYTGGTFTPLFGATQSTINSGYFDAPETELFVGLTQSDNTFLDAGTPLFVSIFNVPGGSGTSTWLSSVDQIVLSDPSWIAPNFTLTTPEILWSLGSTTIAMPLAQFGGATGTYNYNGGSPQITLAAPGPPPSETFDIDVAGADVTVQRYGTGRKAVIFFGYAPFQMEENLKRDYGADFAALVGTEYSMFLWTYPRGVEPYKDVESLEERLLIDESLSFTGQAAAVLSEILAHLDKTGQNFSDVTLVGNSFGAGLLLWDFDLLNEKSPEPRFVLISPSELFLPLKLPNALPRTILISDSERDGYLVSEELIDYIAQRTTGPLPPDYAPGSDNPHFIIGEESTSLAYVFGLIELLHQRTVITSSLTATGQVGERFSYTITANNSSNLRTSFAATGLPAGLSLNSSTGVITGRPTAAGTFRPQVQAINGVGTATGTLKLTIAAAPRPALNVTPTALKGFSAKRGQASKSQRFIISGSNLTTQVTVRAPAGYQVSRSATKGYSSSLKVSPGKSGTLARTTIHVRLAANKKAKLGNRNGNVTVRSAGALTRNVRLTGKITR